MKTIEAIRRDNLLILISEAGSIAELSAKSGVSSSQISQWKNASKESRTGKPRTMNNASARTLELKCGKAAAWMDAPHDEPETRVAQHRIAVMRAETASQGQIDRRAIERETPPYRRDVTPVRLHLDATAQTLTCVNAGDIGLARHALPNDQTQGVLITGGGLSPRIEHREVLIMELAHVAPAIGDTVLVVGPNKHDYAIGRVRSHFAGEVEIDPTGGGKPLAIRGDMLEYWTLKAILTRGALV